MKLELLATILGGLWGAICAFYLYDWLRKPQNDTLYPDTEHYGCGVKEEE